MQLNHTVSLKHLEHLILKFIVNVLELLQENKINFTHFFKIESIIKISAFNAKLMLIFVPKILA